MSQSDGPVSSRRSQGPSYQGARNTGLSNGAPWQSHLDGAGESGRDQNASDSSESSEDKGLDLEANMYAGGDS